MQHTILDCRYRMYCNPYYATFLFYADNTLFQTNELFEVIYQTPLYNFPYIANSYPFGPAYRYTTFYFEGRVISYVLDRIYEFTETTAREIARLPIEIAEEADTYGRLAPIGAAVSLLVNGQFFIAKPPDFNFKIAELPFPAYRNFGFIRTSILYSCERFFYCYLAEGKLLFGTPIECETEFLCCSGGLLFVQKDEIFIIIDVQNMKLTEGPESHVRDFDEVVKLYTCGVLPATFLKLTRFHVYNFETKFSRWRKTVDDDKRCFYVKKYDREPIQKVTPIITYPSNEFAAMKDTGTQTEDSECINLGAVLERLDWDDDLLTGPFLSVRLRGFSTGLKEFKCQISYSHYLFYKQRREKMTKDPVDSHALQALESLAALAKK